MDTQIRKLYMDKKQNPEFMRDINQEIENEVICLLQIIQRKVEKQDYELYKEMAFAALAIGEEGGFVEGFKYAVQLMSECFNCKSMQDFDDF